ncbi:MAG: site-specific DNA-methyltransferase [Anaerolineales bacterium]|nr:site-specific DNA-methyltransferase [Anaerolineales bacterium]
MVPLSQETLFGLEDFTLLTARRKNVIRSPKQYGNSDEDALPYLQEGGWQLIHVPQEIQFQPNTDEPIHRWSPYVQGFSAGFVQRTLDRYRKDYPHPVVLDPFAGSGTVLVQAKLNRCPSVGIELNPLLHFIASVKVNSWHLSPEKWLRTTELILKTCAQPSPPRFAAPSFLKSETHFRIPVLRNLEKLKGAIDALEAATAESLALKNLALLAFASILIDCSNLKRSPCLGYCREKRVADEAPFQLFAQKCQQIAADLQRCQSQYASALNTPSIVVLGNSMSVQIPEKVDLIITSPPYMNGLDYVMNYKIEMGWLGFGQSHRELKGLKDQMVVCDNVSKGLVRQFSQTQRYTHPWIEQIKADIRASIEQRGTYRRQDMPEIVHKYFDDLYQVMRNVVRFLNKGGRFILVVGDSLIADVYVPTDLILARIGEELGLTVERLEKARERRSGQIRSYGLRETILTLLK